MGKKEIKKGDFVRMKHYPFEGQICQITGIPKEGMYLTDRFSLCTDAHFEPIDPKTAFLTELKDLLDKYNASIYVDFDQSDEIYTTTIAVGEDSVKYSHTYGIDTDNVLNYDK